MTALTVVHSRVEPRGCVYGPDREPGQYRCHTCHQQVRSVDVAAPRRAPCPQGR